MTEPNEITYTCDPDNERDVREFVGEQPPCEYCGGTGEYESEHGPRGCAACESRLVFFRDHRGRRVGIDWGDTVRRNERGELMLGELPRSVTAAEVDDLAALREASKEFPYSMLHEAEFHPVLQATAMWNSRVCAQRRQQYHYDLNRRFGKLMKDMGGGRPNEVCAQSWRRQETETPRQLWDEMLRCWRQSRGHWAVVREKHRWIGASVEKGANGVWYATVTVFDPGVAAIDDDDFDISKCQKVNTDD